MLASLNSLDRLRSVCCGDGRNNNSLQTLVLQHLVVVIVDLDTEGHKVLLGPLGLLGVWCEGCDQLGLGCAVQEVEGVTGAHAAEARASNLESAELNHCARCECD